MSLSSGLPGLQTARAFFLRVCKILECKKHHAIGRSFTAVKLPFSVFLTAVVLWRWYSSVLDLLLSFLGPEKKWRKLYLGHQKIVKIHFSEK